MTAADVLGKPFEDTPWWAHSPMFNGAARSHHAGARGEASRYDVRTRGVADEIIDIDFSLQPLRTKPGRSVFCPGRNVITET